VRKEKEEKYNITPSHKEGRRGKIGPHGGSLYLGCHWRGEGEKKEGGYSFLLVVIGRKRGEKEGRMIGSNVTFIFMTVVLK